MASSDLYEKLLKDVDDGTAAAQDLEYFSDTYANLYTAEIEKYNQNCNRRRNLDERRVQFEVQVNTVQKMISTEVKVRNNQDTTVDILTHEINTSQKKCCELVINTVDAVNNIEKSTRDLVQEFDTNKLQAKISETQHSKNMIKETLAKNLELLQRREELMNWLSYTKFEHIQHVVCSLATDEHELTRKELESKDMLNFIKQLEAKLRICGKSVELRNF